MVALPLGRLSGGQPDRPGDDRGGGLRLGGGSIRLLLVGPGSRLGLLSLGLSLMAGASGQLLLLLSLLCLMLSQKLSAMSGVGIGLLLLCLLRGIGGLAGRYLGLLGL